MFVASASFFYVVQLLTQIFVVRSTSLEDYGSFSFTFGVFNILELMALGYSSDLAMQHIGSNSANLKLEQQHTTFSFLIGNDFCFFSTLTLLGLLLSIPLIFLPTFNLFFWICLLFSLIFQIGYASVKNALITYNLASEQTSYEFICSMATLVLSIIFTYIWGIQGYVLSICLYQLFKNIFGFFFLHRLGVNLKVVWEKIYENSNFKSVNLRFAMVSFTRNGLMNLYNQIDIILLGLFLPSSSALAQYKVAKTLSGLPTKIVYPVWAALRGRMVQAHYIGDLKRLKHLVYKPVGVFLFVFVILFILAKWLSPILVPAVYGQDYTEAVPIFLILLGGTLTLQLSNNWFNFWVIMAKQNKAFIVILCIQLLFIFLASLNLLTSPDIFYFSIVIAISSIIGCLLQFFYFFIVYPNRKVENN
jgi:O-antigen/teichoic acid export membrane protein